jgi:hypothetical protein
MNKLSDPDDDLAEYRALVAKVDGAVDAALARAGDQVTCHAGCSSCCVDGLSVLPVEAFAIAAHAAVHGVSSLRAGHDGCVFLDDGGRCGIYATRPLLCRTHGLPLRSTSSPAADAQPPTRGSGLKILDDVSVCALNFNGRAPRPSEALDADVLLQLLVTVDRRYRARVGLPDDASRARLRDLADDLTADDA